MNDEECTCDSILNEAEELGRKSLTDPIPELSDEEGLPYRAETIRFHFTMIVNDLMEKFRALPKEAREGYSESQMRTRIVDTLEKGFETLLFSQTSFHHTPELQHDLREIRDFTRDVFRTVREPDQPYPERLQFSGGLIEYRLPHRESRKKH
jgi:hypothetical protein